MAITGPLHMEIQEDKGILEAADDLQSCLALCCPEWAQAPATGKQHHLVLGGQQH